jgi:hypothetical protein
VLNHPSIRDVIMLHVNGGTNGFTDGSMSSESCLAAIV